MSQQPHPHPASKESSSSEEQPRKVRSSRRRDQSHADSSTRKEHKSREVKNRVRLNRFLASTGLGSRRACEEYILEGRVTVDGEEIEDLAVMVDPDKQKIKVDGELLRAKRKTYYLINKPTGYVCTHRDPEGRPRAIDLVPRGDEGLFTVGRLDENSRGLLIVTNDGDLANQLAHPRYQVLRTYRVQVAGEPTPETLRQLEEGYYFTEGKFYAERVKRVGTHGKSTILDISLRQGRNREIRRLLARAGHKVMFLERISFGPLRLGTLPIGKYRKLTFDEIEALESLARKPQGQGTARKRGPQRPAAPGKAGKPSSRRGAGTQRPAGTKPFKSKQRSTGRKRTTQASSARKRNTR